MTTPSAVCYQALAGEVIRRELALEVTVCLSSGYLDDLTDHYRYLT